MPEVNNIKRKRANRSSYVVNPDGNCTPSDSETDDEEHDHFAQRKILRRQSNNDEDADVELIDGESSNNSNASGEDRINQGNHQLLFAALQKIQELENELAELDDVDDVDYDSGHHDEDDIDEGNASDFGENVQLHDHRDEILGGDAEALGFAFCVKETFEYLAAQGISPDSSIVSSLRERFLDQCNQVPFQ